jgi:hypothetical protein
LSGSPTTTGGTVTPAKNMDSGDDVWKDAEIFQTFLGTSYGNDEQHAGAMDSRQG